MMQNPPHTNGEMTLTQDQQTTIKAKLNEIVQAFTPDEYNQTINTFYIVSTYNKANVGQEINGDTAEYLLNDQKEGE